MAITASGYYGIVLEKASNVILENNVIKHVRTSPPPAKSSDEMIKEARNGW